MPHAIDFTSYPQLDPSKFDIQHDVPVFDEHQDVEPARDETGIVQRDANDKPLAYQPVHYTREVLEAMCENMNSRIRETGDYTPITIGHSKRNSESGDDTPPVYGFAGPFYVGQFGKERPRAAIFAKNWALYREDADNLKKRYPRRSVELWAEPNLKDRYFDPISLLGAETPRRDLGLAYSRVRPECPIVRYSAVFAGGMNTFVPGGSDRKELYQQPEGEPAMITDEDVQKIVMAVMQTAEMGYVRNQMLADESKGSETPAPDAEPEVADGAPPEAGDDEPGPDGNPFDEREGEPETFSDHDEPDGDEPPADEDEDDEEYLDMNTPAPTDKEKENFSRRAKEKITYAKLETENRHLKARVAAQESRLTKIETESAFKERYSKLEDLARAGYPIDVETETEHAKSDAPEAWAIRMSAIEQYAKPALLEAPMLRPMPSPQRASADRLDERARKITERSEFYSKQGLHKPWKELAAEVDRETAAGVVV